jgi:hypothetical protein
MKMANINMKNVNLAFSFIPIILSPAIDQIIAYGRPVLIKGEREMKVVPFATALTDEIQAVSM